MLILTLSGLFGEFFIIIGTTFGVLVFIYYLLDRSRKVLESNKESVNSRINDAYKSNIENIENRNILSKFESDFIDREIIFKHGSWNLFLSGFFIALIIGLLTYIPLNLDSTIITIIIAFILTIFLIPTITNFVRINKMENVIIKSLHPSTDFIEIIKTDYRSLWF